MAQSAPDLVAAPTEEPAPAPELGYGALPGGVHVAAAESLPKGTFAVAALGGFGYRSGLLGDGHHMSRGIGDLAFAVAPIADLTLAVSFDGRYDKHSGAGVSDDGYVGDPHAIARYVKAVGSSVHVGGQLGLWLPGKNAPSIAASAISVDARGLVTLAAGPGTMTISLGYRLDNSVKSVEQPDKLSAADRVSLGVSDFSAVLAGARYAYPLGRSAYVAGELSSDLFVGSNAPGAIVRGAATVGVRVAPAWSVLAFVEAARVPSIAAADLMSGNITLIPYEPLVTGGVGLQGRFGGTHHRVETGLGVRKNSEKRAVEVVEYADISGDVVDDKGKPVVGAKVTVRLKNNTASGVTDEKGHWKARVPIGKTVDGATTLDDTGAEIEVAVDDTTRSKTTLTLVKGANDVPRVALDPIHPPGQLLVVLRAAGSGAPIANGTVTVEPGGITAKSGPDGQVRIDLPPGQYKAKATAPGFKDQSLDVKIDEGGVAVKNFELPK